MSTSPTPQDVIVPMQALHERIDQVRTVRKDLPQQLRQIALEIPNSGTRRTLGRMADAVEFGSSAAQLAAAFRDHCWLLTLQSSAATTDALTAVLEQSAYQHRIQLKKLRTIAYPTVLLTITLGMTVLALQYLIPPFDEMYQEFELQLPAPTLMLIAASRWVNTFPPLAVVVVILLTLAIGGALWAWISDGPIKRKLFGPSVDLSSIRQSLAMVSLQISDLSDEGIDLAKALRISAESSPNDVMRGLMAALAVTAASDSKKLRLTRAAMFLPPNFIYALSTPPARPADAASKTAGKPATLPNATMLRELAANYRDLSIRNREWMSFVLAQVCVISVGLLIGYIVLALFMPLVSLVSALA